MKKIVLWALLLLSGATASAQYYYEDVYNNSSYEYTIGPGIDLTGEQWHLAQMSILAAANNLYLIIDGTNRFVRTLHHFDRGYYERLWRCRISSYRPYYHNGTLGWYIVAGLINYFVYPNGHWVRLSSAPCYYAYHYDIAHRHRLNFYDWHFRKHLNRPYKYAPRYRAHPKYRQENRYLPQRKEYRDKKEYRRPEYRHKQNVRTHRSSASTRHEQREVRVRR